MFFDTFTLVLWRPQYEEIRETCTEILKEAKIRTRKTPDTEYVVIKWRDVGDANISEILKYTETVRHSFIGVNYDNNEIFSHYETDDSLGCDEEFAYALSYVVSVSVNI